MTKDVKSVIDEFHSSVNMTAKELESWLLTEESQSVGQKKEDDESIGHKSGKHIVELLQKKKDDYTDDDLSHMKKVITLRVRQSLMGGTPKTALAQLYSSPFCTTTRWRC